MEARAFRGRAVKPVLLPHRRDRWHVPPPPPASRLCSRCTDCIVLLCTGELQLLLNYSEEKTEEQAAAEEKKGK